MRVSIQANTLTEMLPTEDYDADVSLEFFTQEYEHKYKTKTPFTSMTIIISDPPTSSMTKNEAIKHILAGVLEQNKFCYFTSHASSIKEANALSILTGEQWVSIRSEIGST